MVLERGLFCKLYTDLGSHYFYTPEPGPAARLGVRHIGAHSPEARGRSERMFRTLQDGVPKELRLQEQRVVANDNTVS